MGEVKQSLIPGICMNGCHQAAFDAKPVEDNLGNGSQTICSTGGIGNNTMPALQLQMIWLGIGPLRAGGVPRTTAAPARGLDRWIRLLAQEAVGNDCTTKISVIPQFS